MGQTCEVGLVWKKLLKWLFLLLAAILSFYFSLHFPSYVPCSMMQSNPEQQSDKKTPGTPFRLFPEIFPSNFREQSTPSFLHSPLGFFSFHSNFLASFLTSHEGSSLCHPNATESFAAMASPLSAILWYSFSWHFPTPAYSSLSMQANSEQHSGPLPLR